MGAYGCVWAEVIPGSDDEGVAGIKQNGGLPALSCLHCIHIQHQQSAFERLANCMPKYRRIRVQENPLLEGTIQVCLD